MRKLTYILTILGGLFLACNLSGNKTNISSTTELLLKSPVSVAGFTKNFDSVPFKNKCVIDTVVKYGAKISPTYNQAVCTELVIKIIQKFYYLDKTDKSRIRIITNEDIYDLLAKDSPIPKGVYYALTKKGIGKPIDNIQQVQPGDFVQFWTIGWGHCGIVKSIDCEAKTMELYSSFPSTDGYGIHEFEIPKYCYFVRLQ